MKQKETEGTKTPAKRKGAAALRAQSAAADISEPQTPARSNGGDVGEPSSRKSPTPAAVKDDDDRAISPVSTTSSASEPPLAQKVKMNGNHITKRPTTPPPPIPVPVPSTPVKQQPPDIPMSNSVAPPAAATATTTSPSRASVRSSNEHSILMHINNLAFSFAVY